MSWICFFVSFGVQEKKKLKKYLFCCFGVSLLSNVQGSRAFCKVLQHPDWYVPSQLHVHTVLDRYSITYCIKWIIIDSKSKFILTQVSIIRFHHFCQVTSNMLEKVNPKAIETMFFKGIWSLSKRQNETLPKTTHKEICYHQYNSSSLNL